MATYQLPFGYAAWPEDTAESRRATVASDAERVPRARLTVELPTPLKRRVEASAALAGVPPDAWIERTLARSVDPRLEGVGCR